VITAGLTNNARFDFLDSLRGDIIKIALYSTFADIGPQTTAYTPENEVPESGDYVAGGMALQGYTAALDGRTALLDWVDPVWEQTTIAAQGALIYNASKNNRAVAVLDFGEIIVSTNSTFRVKLPEPTARTAIITFRP
jgi:hypothetical protein